MRSNHQAWRYGDNINTDLIFPGKYTYTVTDRAQMAKHALEDLDPAFAHNAKRGDVIVAGRNWGNGSSREQAVTCLVELGIYAVIAHSFARIFYRNAINNGLLVIACPEVVKHVAMGNTIQLDTTLGKLIHNSGVYDFPQLPAAVQDIVNAGGLIPYLQRRYADSGGS